MKKVYEASSPGCSRVLENVMDKFSSRTKSAVSRLLMLVCFAILGLSSASAQGGGCPNGSCSITCPPDISLCLATDNYGLSEITPAWVASHASSPVPSCTQFRVWKDAMGMEELDQSIWVDCDKVGDHVDLWVSVEKPLWVECRSSLVRVRVHIKDCEPPAVICPPMGMFVCNDDIPRPGINWPHPALGPWKFISYATFQGLGGSATDACGIDFVVYRDFLESVDPVCKTNRTIRREFWVYDVNGNSKHCNQMLVVADNVPPTFTADPADLTINCDASNQQMVNAINGWLNVNTDPGNQAGPDAVVVDNCDENMVMMIAEPGSAVAIINQMPAACDPNPREVIVVFSATDGCGNESTRSAKVKFVDYVKPSIGNLQTLFRLCMDDVPAPNPANVPVSDNCTPTNKIVVEHVGDVVSNETCPNKKTITRTYRATDCAGNSTTKAQTINVSDFVDPWWNPPPTPLNLMNVCNLADLTAQIQAWLDNHGDGIAQDNCGTVTVSYNRTAADMAADLLNFCAPPPGNTKISFVTFTATDACGNQAPFGSWVTLMDNEAPTGTAPANAMYDCKEDVPAMSTAQVTGVSDNCSPNSVLVEIVDDPTPQDGCVANPFTIIRRWKLTDCAGNMRTLTQVINVKDQTPPVWNTPPSDLSISCSNPIKGSLIELWLTARGGGNATDNCTGGVTYTHAPGSVAAILSQLGACQPYNGETTVTFTAKDACGNRQTATAKVIVFDNVNPTASAVTSQYSCISQIPAANPAVITNEDDNCTPAGDVKVVFLSESNNGGAGCMASPYVLTRWYKLTDCAGNTSSVSHQITVIDMIAPNAICKALIRDLGANGIVTVNASEFDNGSTDNCMIDKIQIRRGTSGPWFDAIDFNCDDIPNIPNCGANVQNTGIVTVQMRVQDKCGNQEICTTTITVRDLIPPVVECPADMTVLTSDRPGYDCKANATWTHPIPTDNCSVPCMEMEVQKEINGVWTTINPANNFPTPNFVTNIAPANFGGQAGPYTFAKGPYCDDNQYKIIYRVRDEHGNNKPGPMCMFIITVKDDEAPLWNDCPVAPIVAQTVTGDCYQLKCYKRPTAYDNCEYPVGPCPAPTVVVTVSDPTIMINQVGTEDCALFPVGTTHVWYTATDHEGNVSTCTVTVEISDPQAPMAMCVGAYTVNLEPNGKKVITFADIDAGSTDNCGLCAKEVSRDGVNFGPNVTLTCADLAGPVTITLRVKDCSTPANEASCTTVVTVEDMQSPGPAFCPADITVGTDDNVCNAVVNYNAPSFNDGCGSAHPGTLILGLASGSTFPIGVTHVQYSYTSLSGYTVYCDFNVTVEDDQAPTIVCPANVLNLTCLQSLPAPLTAGAFTGGTLTDNCGITALESSDYDNDLTHCAFDGIRTIVRTYVAFDAAGNSSTCEQTFQYLEDTEAPVLVVKPIDLTFECADQIPALPVQSATDNCGTVNIDTYEEIQPGGCENQFVVVRRWVATDLCGNTSDWWQHITVNDNEPPVFLVTPLRLHLDCIEDVPAAPYQTATDNCGVAFVDFSESTDPGECINSVIITRRWVAYDLCGNTAEWEQEIIVLDTFPPTLSVTPVDRTYECAEEVEAAPVQVASDNCGVAFVDFSETINPGSCPNQYEILRRWYAYDLCGNVTDHWQHITVHDDVPPVLLTTPLDQTVTCADDVPVAPVGNATDNCDVVFVDFSESIIHGDCHNQFTVVRRWLATDLCGNTDEHWQHILVFDGIAPIFNEAVPPANVNVQCAQQVPAAAVLTATDNCDGSVVVIYSEELVPGDCQDKFSIIRTWTAEDLCGNLLRYTQTVNVFDDQAPVWDQAAPQNPVVECSEDVPAVPTQTATDNCVNPVTMDFSEVTVPGTCPNQYQVVRTWVAMDACGNATTRVQTVTVSDIEAPTWTTPAPAASLSFQCAEEVPPPPAQAATDNCDQPLDTEYYEVLDPGTCPNSFIITRVWTAEDDCGNATSRQQVITVQDTQAPVWNQPAPASPVNVECAEQVPAVPVQTATDNCDVPVDINFNEVINWGTCHNQFQVVRTWTAADDCGNITTRVQVINVSDTKAPTWNQPAPASPVNVECSEQVPAVPVQTASDNCASPIYVDFSEVVSPGTCPNQFSVTRTWIAMDDCGNATTRVQVINVSDTEAPVLAGLPAATVNVECSEQVPAVPVVTATDNCDVPIVLQFSEVEIPGTCPNQYVITRTWSAQDDCGNSTFFVQTITISDTKAPVFAGLPVAVVNVECSEQVPALAVVTATDNCAAPVDIEISEIEIPGTCANQYSITRTWTAEDDCGNSTFFVQTINISDTQAPTWNEAAPASPVNVECSEQVPAVPVQTASDNCAAPIYIDFSEIITPGTCPNQFSLTRTWIAMDDCGNATTRVQVINVSDIVAPVLVGLPAATVNVECSEEVPAVPVVTATDNCAAPVVLQFSEVEIPGTCPNQYSITRTWSAQDDCGNSTFFVQTININDTEAPQWDAAVPVVWINEIHYDNVGNDVDEFIEVAGTAGLDLSAYSIVLYNGANGLSYGTMNLAGSIDAESNGFGAVSFAYPVNGVQNGAPDGMALVLNGNMVLQFLSYEGAFMAVDGPANGMMSSDIGVLEDGSDPVGMSLRLSGTGNKYGDFVWNAPAPATAGSLNTGQTMTVAPGLALPVNLTLQCGEDVPMPLVLTATDNCNAPVDVEYSEVFLPGAGPNDGVTIIRTWTAEDDCGNAIVHTQTITVNDAEAPVLVGTPDAAVAVDCSENVPAVAVVTVTDNCQGTVDLDFNEVEVPGTCPNQYSIVRTWSATDFAGNTAVFTQTITINDTQAPVFDQVVTTPLNVTCAADVPAAPAITASDNCNAPVFVDFSETVTPGNCLNKFTLVRTWVAQDDCGNGTSIQQVINVNDDVAPVMSCPAPLMAQCNPAEHPPYANLAEFETAGGTASDNCGLNVNSFGMISEVANGNVYTRTYRVVDQCGNAGTCTQTVTVLDTQAPVFLNCPVGPLVFGNDPDKCSAKINWPAPVAVDNCSIPTVVQTSGPTAGSIVPVGNYTVSFTATDAMGNTKVCSFQVMVMDTQNPEFDADIVMPANVTVECDAVPAPFVLTTDDVHDNCTPSNLLVITFTEVRTNGNCKFNYTLTRTWKVTDQAGNMLVHTQIVTVRDTKKPTAICKNATVTLDKFGNATVLASAINNGSFDNCSAQADLTLTVSPSAFTCANLGANVVTLTVTDECGNSATCTATVTVLEGIGPCAPQYSVVTTCMNNATTLENGQFMELITVKSLAMQTWTISANTGFYSTASPAPPGAPVALAVGTAFTAGTADGIDNDGDGQIDEADEMVFYTLKGIHVEAIGYTLSVTNNLNQVGTISNKGYYPTPYFINLNDPFCLSTPPFVIEVGETNGAQGNVINIMVNGVATNTFNAAQLGLGFHTVMATFDAGSATTNLVINGNLVGGTNAQALADPGCQQKITKIVHVVSTPTTIVCNDLVNVSLHNDGGDCVFIIAPDDVLEGSYLCDDDYSVVLTYPFGTHTFNPANRVDYTHIGKTLTFNLVHALSGNVCWGKIKVEDKEPPKLTCPANVTIKCSDPTTPSFTGTVLISDCSPSITSVNTDDFTDFGSCSNPRAQIIRTWLVTDGSGNQSTCSQTITIAPFNLADVQFPADVTLNCANVNSTDPGVTGSPTINGSPIGSGGMCMASISKTDEFYTICPGSYEIIRTWKVRNMCLPVGQGNPVEHVQVIKIIDTQGPVFNCPSNVVVSTDPFSCCATADLPDLIITEACSKIASLAYKVTGIDITTGNLVLIEGTGSLSDFPGNNHWDPDTMAVFGFTSCLPLGDYTVTYTAVDGCGNVSNCTFTLTVEDQIPPVTACDEFTQVALGIDGMAFINAYTFDDGSYDVCYDVHFKARRMNDNDCQDADFFYDQVKFCCDDINDTIQVVFRVYDVPVPNGPIGLDDYDGHYNDCMVRVFVEDKIKPLCNAPANVTVSCEDFDPSLWTYGFATSGDNCCVDTITTSVSYSLFDTLCSKGTITRTFRAFDCGGLSSQCTQRVFVNYEQDYFVKFPNDVIVTVCDGTGVYGEPTFFGEDCELLGVSHEDEVFTVVPDACFKIERTWTIINWCTYNPNAGCINVPNPNPNATSNHPSNLPGPTVSPAGTPAPWAPTVVKINSTDPTTTNYSTFWNANANCYKYKQIIKVIDGQKPIVNNCPTSPVEVCDITPNNTQLWNESYWFDSATSKHDLCEAPTDLTISATDLCSGASVNIRYLLFLDLDNDGNMETVISSTNLPGFNNVQFGNAANPSFSGGTPRQFDERPVLPNQKYGFALQTSVSGSDKTASVRWNTQQQPSNYVIPELPYGTHKIKWIVEDGCGNEVVCEYTFIVKDCKKPTVVCLNGLSVNIMPTQMIALGANDFLQYTEDNCTPSNQLVIGIRKSGAGTGFPTNPNGTPQTSVTFTCDELGTQLVELWSMDLAGNADFCETYVIVQDPNGFCSNNFGTVAGTLKTETSNGLEDANVELDGSSPALPPTNMFQFSKQDGSYQFAGVPFLGDYTVTPTKDNDPLNGVSTYDLVLINKHILGLEPLNSPYKMIAADANNSRSVTTFDIVELRKLILGIYTELPNNTSWRFVDKQFGFPNPLNPFETIFPETKQIATMQNSMADENFVSVKVGDVNLNAVASSLMNSEDRTEGTLLFDVKDRTVKAGETFTLNFRAAERNLGYQFTLHFPNMEVVDVTPGAEMTMTNFGVFNGDHSLTTSFDNEHTVGEFAVTFRAKAAGTISKMLTVSSRITKAEAYDLNRSRQSVALRFNGNNGTTVTGLGFELYQNQPNPWMNKTQIGFYLPEATDATLTIFDESGRTVFTQSGVFSKGYNAFAIERALVNTTGVLYYKLETTTDSAVKKMIQTK